MKFHIKYLLLICVLLAGASFNSVWAEDKTITLTYSSFGLTTNSYAKKDATVSGVGFTVDKGYKGSGNSIQMNSSQGNGILYNTTAIQGLKSITVNVSSGSKTYTIKTGTSQKPTSNSQTGTSTGAYNAKSGDTYFQLSVSGASYFSSIVITYSDKASAGLAYATSSYSGILPSSSFETPALTNPNGLTVSYSSSNTSVASVNSSTGAITIGTTEGTTTITASSEETEDYAAGTASYTITVAKGISTVTLNKTALTFNVVDGITQALTGTPKYNDEAIDGAVVTWSVVSGSDYASVSDAGVVSAIAPGLATIRASYAGSTVYAASYADCAVTVNKANTAITLTTSDVTTIDLKPANKANVRLNASVKAIKSDESQVNVVSPTITWTSSDETVATVSEGVVTGLKVGSATITASYAGGANYNAATNATCDITVSDTRTAVNMSSFTAGKTTLVIDDVEATNVTNDQAGWTAAYTYTSSDESVATVASDGKITAIRKGTATITATLNVADNDATYKAGATASKTLEITVNKHSHTVTFSVNGNTDLTASVEEDQKITFPTAVETTPGDNEFAKVINGQTFVGWYTAEYSNASVAPEYVDASSANMGDSDVTYYAVYADEEEEESDNLADAVKSQTLEYDTWSYSGSTTNKSSNNYRLFHSGSYIESASFDLSKLIKVIVKGGTFGGSSYNSLTIGDGTNVWKNVTVSGSSETGTNTFTGGTALSGTNKLRIICNSGTASSTGVRISKVEIYVKGILKSYSHFNTTVSELPRPEITLSDVVMTWGDADKYVVPSATVDDEPYEGTFAYESSDANLTVASDGKLTCNVPGSYTVIAKIAATGSYQAAEKTCNVTVNKKDINLSFDVSEVIKMDTDETKTYTKTASVSPVAYDGTITYAKNGSGSASINTSTGEVTYTASTGVNTITATASATDLYNGNTASYTLYVKTTPTITVSNQTLAYGETYEPSITGGTAGFSSDPAGMISVDGIVITAAAVGTATVTVVTEANDTYIAGEASFTLTVTAPTGSSTTPDSDPVTVFYESFDRSTGSTGTDWNSASGTLYMDNAGWTNNKENGGGSCGRFGTSGTEGSAKTPSIDVSVGTIYTLTFKAAPWGTDDTKMSLTVTGGTATGLSASNMNKKQWNNLSATITATSTTMTVQFTASNNRFFLDEVRLTRPGDPINSVETTIPLSGFGTYCSVYPLDLDLLDEDAKAYIVTSVEGTNVTLKRITGTIKGGVPFILYGESGAHTLYTAESSSTVPASNMLVGTLAPTYITATNGDYTNFGMKSGKFVKAANGVMPANKAYLPVLTSSLGGGAREFNFIFDDDTTTGIKSMNNGQLTIDNEAVYDLQGRKVAQPTKGGLYIVNGRKVVIK